MSHWSERPDEVVRGGPVVNEAKGRTAVCSGVLLAHIFINRTIYLPFRIFYN